MRRRLLSLLLVFVLVLGMIPVAAFAQAIPFSATLNDVALEIEQDGTYDLVDYAMQFPAYKITVPAETADDATVSISGEGLVAALTENDFATNVDLTAMPVVYDYAYFLINQGSVPACAISFVKAESTPENIAPGLKLESASASAKVTVGTPYTLDLTTVFADADDGDILMYTVSVNDGEAVATEGSYSYTPAEAGETKLVFVANDGRADSPSFTVILTAEEEKVDEEASCLSVAADASTGGKIQAGEKYSLKLSDVFADSEGHALTYSFVSTVENQHTKIVDDVFYFSAAAGTYEVTLTAKCEGMEISHKLTITVEAGNVGIPEQYNYNETAADSVTVYVTLSNDGYPVVGADGTVLSHLEVTVPYFDLTLYGLQDYYRYGTDGGSGPYTNTTVIQRPTGLHLYLYLLERYYMGLDEEDCGKGTSSVLSYAANTDVLYMDGTTAYNSDGNRALQITGGPTSLYMFNFWGHDENLMYFRNHCYPYMSPGWGSTSDYILLSDGDTWDVAMFSNWEFHNYGYFARFDQDEYTAEAGKSLTVKTQKWGTNAATGAFADVSGLELGLYTDEWELVKDATVSYTNGNEVTFKAPEKAGTYYLLALDPSAQDAEHACIAPATAIVTVKDKVECETCTDADSNRICDVCGKNLNHAPTLKEGVTNTTATVQTGIPYQLDDLMNGKIFEDKDGDSLNYERYSYRKSSDGGKTWGDWTNFENLHGSITKSLSNSEEGTYLYEFRAYDCYEYSEARWFLTLNVLDVVPANLKFYLSKDHQYSTTEGAEHLQYPVLELYRTAGIDDDMYDYVGWFEKDGKTVYVYNPKDYTIVDGEQDYVVIDEVQYELHDYEKISFTNSAFDASDETATPSGTVVDNYNMFYVTVLTGRYSTRVYGYNAEKAAYDIYLGGQSMELPREKDIYGNGGENMYLRQISIYTTSKKLDGSYFTADDYYAEIIMPITGSMIHAGDPYVSGNYTYYPFFSWACGNGSLYNTYVYPYDTDNYIFAQAGNQTTSASASIEKKSMTIGSAMTLTVHVPESADFGLYFQYNNFNTREVEPYGEAVVNGDGTKTLTYKVTKNNSNYSWRLSDPSGKYVTKAGWLASLTAPAEKTYTFSASTNKKSHDFSNLGTTVAKRDEADLQVFLSDSGFKSVSGKTRIRAYRMWQLINTDPGNIMLEPDFNVQVLQGNLSDIKQVSGGNAKGNWIDVTPTTTDIVAVTYDAIDVIHTNDTYGAMAGFFPATNPERTNVFIITNQAAGSAAAHIPFNGSKETDRGSEWDYNYDTWHYLNTNTNPTMHFTVSGTGTVNVSYATVITNDALQSTMSAWNPLSPDAEGNYNISLLPFRNAGRKGGTVIIKLTDSTGTSYAMARVAEMSATVSNVTSDGEPITPGDQVKVTFDGLYRSINKISGIFNPTQYNQVYYLNDVKYTGGVAQYVQMDTANFTFTVPADFPFPEGETSVNTALTNGYVDGTMLAAASPFHSMYYITDTGVGTNFSAVGVTYVLSRMDDIPITITKKASFDLKVQLMEGETVTTNDGFTLSAPDGTALTPDENGIYQDLDAGTYTYTFRRDGYILKAGELRLSGYDVSDVVDGILTRTIAVAKPTGGQWDGYSVTEPKSENGVYQISNGAELAWFAQTVNGGSTGISAELTADVDLMNCQWTPIGNSANNFAGSFDGKNYTIDNLYINYSSTEKTAPYLGLFGYMKGAQLSNFTVNGAITMTSTVSVSSAYSGGVVGYANGGSITNVHSGVDITVNRVQGNWARVGGITGHAAAGTPITNCSNTGDIKGYQYVGGIVGYAYNEITGCYNSGNLSGYQYIGGIAGTAAPANIKNCYNTGAVSATNNYVGGIIASNSSTGVMTNCFNTGKITFGGTSAYAGSVIGYSNNSKGTNANLYYLEGTYTTGIGKNQNTVGAEAVSAETLASRDFAKAMNTGLETPAYAVGTDHPILTWQDPSAEVLVPVLVSQLTLSAENLTVYLGETAQLTATVNEDAENKTLTWTSSDNTIATVDETGLVTPVAAGEATITVSSNDGSGKTATCTVTVAEKPAVEVIAGDFDGNGSVTMVDVNAAFNAYMNEDELTDAQKAAVDTNSNGIVDMAEVNAIFNIYMNE